jgi:predicted Zn-ribbon and HTH transcriptional regulator
VVTEARRSAIAVIERQNLIPIRFQFLLWLNSEGLFSSRNLRLKLDEALSPKVRLATLGRALEPIELSIVRGHSRVLLSPVRCRKAKIFFRATALKPPERDSGCKLNSAIFLSFLAP